jgi:hypothetical protein
MEASLTTSRVRGSVSDIAQAVDLIKQNGLPAGIGAHDLATVKACVDYGIEPDFWMKTFHQTNYWSARTDQVENGLGIMDNLWCSEPEDTAAYMRGLCSTVDSLQDPCGGGVRPERGLPVRLRERSGFHLCGHVRFPDRGRCQYRHRCPQGRPEQEAPLDGISGCSHICDNPNHRSKKCLISLFPRQLKYSCRHAGTGPFAFHGTFNYVINNTFRDYNYLNMRITHIWGGDYRKNYKGSPEFINKMMDYWNDDMHSPAASRKTAAFPMSAKISARWWIMSTPLSSWISTVLMSLPSRFSGAACRFSSALR